MNIKNLQTTYLKIDLRFYAVLISIFLSVIALLCQDPINYDGILYLDTAAIYLKSGLHAAIQLYAWPFYSILIAWISQLTHLSLLHSAYLLDSFLVASTVAAFITILYELQINAIGLIIGTFVILFYAQFNDYRNFVIRDFGYWAFTLIALWQLLRYSNAFKWRYAIAWNVYILLAALFRIEGLILWLSTPFILFFLPQIRYTQRGVAFTKIYCLTILLIVLALIVYFTFHPETIDTSRIPRLIDEIKNGAGLILQKFQESLSIIANRILAPYAGEDALLFTLWGVAGLFIIHIGKALGLAYIILLTYALFRRLTPGNPKQKILLQGFLWLNLLIPLIFFTQYFFVSDRYLVMFCLIALLWSPSALYNLHQIWQQKQKKYRWLFPVAAILLFINAFSGIIHFGYSKAYITQAGIWLQENTPTNASVYSNNKQVLFYAKRTPIDWNIPAELRYDDGQPLKTVQGNEWKNYDYLALRIMHQSLIDKNKILDTINLTPIKSFQNKRGDTVLIFKLPLPPNGQ